MMTPAGAGLIRRPATDEREAAVSRLRGLAHSYVLAKRTGGPPSSATIEPELEAALRQGRLLGCMSAEPAPARLARALVGLLDAGSGWAGSDGLATAEQVAAALADLVVTVVLRTPADPARASVIWSSSGEAADDLEELPVPVRPDLPQGPEIGDFSEVTARWRGEWPM